MTKKFYTRYEACHILGVSISTIARLLARGELQAYRVGNLVRISAKQLNKYLSSHQIGKE